MKKLISFLFLFFLSCKYLRRSLSIVYNFYTSEKNAKKRVDKLLNDVVIIGNYKAKFMYII